MACDAGAAVRPRVDHARLIEIGRELLVAIGEDPQRPGLVDTPRRFADSWREFIEYEPGRLGTTFSDVQTDQMVVVRGMRVWSLCEHHLAPFWCDVTVAYIARDKVLGLSKLARIAHKQAHKLQLQEQLAHEIADGIERHSGSPDVAVLAEGQHLCMTMRGIRTPGMMVTSVTRGLFRSAADTRMEFLRLAQAS